MTESISIICSIDEYDVTGSCYEETQAAQEQAISTVPLESSTIGACGGIPEEKQTNSTHAINPETIVSEQGPKEAKESSYEKWKRRRIISLYLLTISILFADMNLLAPNLSTIADEFGFDDDERDVKLGGLIALGFFFVGAPVSFVVGWLADSINRSPLYSATVFVGEIGCLMTAFVKTYPALYACRVLTGISIGGAIPVIYSVLGDLYPANQRAGIAAVVTTGTGLGMGIGQVIAGSLDDWRLPFIIVSIPGLICSMLLLFVQDPRRGEKEQAFLEKRNQLINADSTLTDGEDIVVPVVRGNHFESLENCGMDCPTSNSTSCRDTVQRISRIQNDAPELNNTRDAPRRSIKSSHCVTCQSTKEILKIPSVLLTILQAAPGALPFGFCATFLNDFLQEQRGMTKQQATGVLLTFGAGNAVGVILGGVLGHFSYKRDVRGPPFFMGVSLILGCIPFYFLVNTVDQNGTVGVVSAITIISGILVVIPVPLERSILTNVCLPQSRGRANALVSIVDDLGKGLGPALVSVLITTFDRQTAFNISLIGWIIGGLLSLAIMFFVGNDEKAVQETLRIQLSGNLDGE